MVNPDPKFQDKKRYVKLRVQGSNQQAIMPPEEVPEFTDGEEYIVSDVWMTPHEYESLPEFTGY
jgi:hypothetical protein